MERSKPLTVRQQAFLDAYRVTGMVKPAAAQVGCSRELHYGAMRTSETYREAFSLAQLELVDELEEEARRRALHGVRIPVVRRGKVIGYETRYSDSLMVFLLEGNDPEKFAEIREELGDSDVEFCVRWDREEVARPTLPRMTGPQPPGPPKPPRPPFPSASECGETIAYREWDAARACIGTRETLGAEEMERWAAGVECGAVERGVEQVAGEDEQGGW